MHTHPKKLVFALFDAALTLAAMKPDGRTNSPDRPQSEAAIGAAIIRRIGRRLQSGNGLPPA